MTHHFTYRFEKYPLRGMRLDQLLGIDCVRENTERLREHAGAPERELPANNALRRFADLLDSPTCRAALSTVSGHDFEDPKIWVSSFASRYRPGDFLATHLDGRRPRVMGYVLNMSRDWLVHWGGQLVILNEAQDAIVESFHPRPNSMVLFDVPLPHAVVAIAQNAQAARYAISGWYLEPFSGSASR